MSEVWIYRSWLGVVAMYTLLSAHHALYMYVLGVWKLSCSNWTSWATYMLHKSHFSFRMLWVSEVWIYRSRPGVAAVYSHSLAQYSYHTHILGVSTLCNSSQTSLSANIHCIMSFLLGFRLGRAVNISFTVGYDGRLHILSDLLLLHVWLVCLWEADKCLFRHN